MKNIFIAILATFAVSAHAGTDWEKKLEDYRAQVQTYGSAALFVSQLENYSASGVGCVGSAAASMIAFVSDTVPLTNPVSEYIASKADENYEIYQSLLSWETLVGLGRSAAGGALVGGYESFEFILYWLSGDTHRSFEELKKTYASTFATLDALFAKDSACVMFAARAAIVRAEWRRRSGEAPVVPFTPMHLN